MRLHRRHFLTVCVQLNSVEKYDVSWNNNMSLEIFGSVVQRKRDANVSVLQKYDPITILTFSFLVTLILHFDLQLLLAHQNS